MSESSDLRPLAARVQAEEAFKEMRIWQERYPYYQTTVPEAYHAFLGVWKILRGLEAALAAAPQEPVTHHQTCINCGQHDRGGFEVEDGPGPFCEDCWDLLENHFTQAALAAALAPKSEDK